jgi:hypothetical protein
LTKLNLLKIYKYLVHFKTNCTGERSFSVPKRIKNKLMSSLGQAILDTLGILSIENNTNASINFDEVIDAFEKKRLNIFFLILKILYYLHSITYCLIYFKIFFFNYEDFVKKSTYILI